MKRNLAVIGLAVLGGAAFSLGVMNMKTAAAEETAFDTAQIVMTKGASVRCYSGSTAESGIRFSSAISAEDYAALEAMETNGVKVSYGMLIAPYDYFTDYGEFNAATVFGVEGKKKYTWDGESVEEGTSYTKIAHVTYDTLALSTLDGYEDDYAINGSLIKIKEENLTKEFVGRGYIKYEMGNVVKYKFADFHNGSVENNVRSIAYVSQLAIEANDPVASWVQANYLSKVTQEATTYTVETYVGDELVKQEKRPTTIGALVQNAAVNEYEGYRLVSAEREGTAYANGHLTLKHVYEEIENNDFQVANGDFGTGDLTGWTLAGNIGAVSSETHYWKNDPISEQGFPYGLDGTYMFSAYEGVDLEKNMGALTSSPFTVSESGWISFKLGGAQNNLFVYVDVVDAATGEIYHRYSNQNHKYEVVNGVRLGCELNAYKANVQDIVGKQVYLRVSDFASKDFGLFFLDSVKTLHLAEPNDSYTLANEVEHQATVYDLYNGNFDKNLDAWTKDGDIGVINENKKYWTNNENYDYNNDGKFFSAYETVGNEGVNYESNKGTLRSNVFEIGGSGWITYAIGGMKNFNQVYMEVIDAVTGMKYGHFYNTNMFHCSLIQYKADLSDFIGELVYINFVDNATGDYGLIFCDSIKTYYASEPTGDYIVATNCVYNVMNGGFETGDLFGWTLEGGEIGFLTQENCYWSRDELGFNKEGTWVYTGVEVAGHGHVEGNTGTLRSDTFIVKANSTFCFKLGGGRWENTHRTDVGVRLVKADGTVIGEYYNTNGYNGDQTGIMVDYSIELNNAEEMACYIEIFDNATSGWGLLAVDDLRIIQNA